MDSSEIFVHQRIDEDKRFPFLNPVMQDLR
jgi:hypothetical protein